MKERILKIGQNLIDSKYFTDASLSLTINYEAKIYDFDKILLDYQKIEDALSLIDEEISSFNLTVKLEVGTKNIENYEDNWRSFSLAFYTCQEENRDPSKYCYFTCDYLGDNQHLNLHSKMGNWDEDESSHIYENYCEYENVPKIIETIIEIDKETSQYSKNLNNIIKSLRYE